MVSFDNNKIKEEKRYIGNIDYVNPSFNRVLVKLNKKAEKSEGGIIFLDSEIERDSQQGGIGIIAKMGPLAFLDHPKEFKVGATVLTTFYVGLLYEDSEGNHYKILQDSEIQTLREPVEGFEI